MATVTLTIQGMTCSHCVMAVQRALAAVPGVSSATVTLAPPRARVECDAAVSVEALAAAVAKAGYVAA